MNRQISISLSLSICAHTLVFLAFPFRIEKLGAGKPDVRHHEIVVFLDSLAQSDEDKAAHFENPHSPEQLIESSKIEPAPPSSTNPRDLPVAPNPQEPLRMISKSSEESPPEEEIEGSRVRAATFPPKSSESESPPQIHANSSRLESSSERLPATGPPANTEKPGAPQTRAIAAQAPGGDSGPVEISQPSYRRYVQPKYPSRAVRSGHQGLVVVDLEIDPDGRATRVTVERSSGFPLLDNAAIAAARQARYHPALQDGRNVSSRASARYRFQLPGSSR